LVRAAVDGRPGVEFALQTEQLGTGHAVMACRELLADCDGPVLVVTGDAPLMQSDSVAALLGDYRRRAGGTDETESGCVPLGQSQWHTSTVPPSRLLPSTRDCPLYSLPTFKVANPTLMVKGSPQASPTHPV
jgi:hypothetical protein